LARVLPSLAERGIDVRLAARHVVEPRAFGIRAATIAWAKDDAPSDARAARIVAETIADWRPDAVMTSNVHDAAVLQAARTARRLIVRVHDHRLFCPQGNRQYPHFPTLCTKPMSAGTCVANALLRGCGPGLSARTVRLVRARETLRKIVVQADHVVVSSRFMAGLCGINGVAAERIRTLPPPFSGEPVTVAAPRPERDRILFAGRLVRDKGLASLIRAIARIAPERRPQLAAAGAATEESSDVPALAARLGVELTMLGKLASSELNAAIDASTLVAVPSLWPEPFGLMGIEAQARGRPVVAYDVGGISEWMGDAGILVPREDEPALAAAMETVSDSARWPAYSAAALRQARAYAARDHVDALIRLFTTPARAKGAIS
jgi:glycosyltransferase involved in cell wall biosynthesis